MAGDIDISVAEGIATLRLRNPAKRNAISATMWTQIGEFAASVGTREDVRVAIVRGDGALAFSAGADIDDFGEARSGAANAKGYDDLVEETCLAVEAIPQPTIALIHGACMGAGVSLAASCDLRIAAEDAFFAVPAAKLGLGYDPRGIARFLRIFGANAARQILFTADRVPAARLHAIGGLQGLHAADEIDTIVHTLARTIAANAPLTIKAAKVAIRAHSRNDRVLLAEADKLYRAADASEDYAEGRKAFAEKRVPRFGGR